MSIWFEELLYEEIRLKFKIDRVLADIETRLGQHIQIFETPSFGKVFCLDSIIQCTEADEYYYHELMAHVPLTAHDDVKNVLIVGGASGALAREVLKHSVHHVDLVEIDSEVMATCQSFLGDINKNSFDDPRLNVHICDATHWVIKNRSRYDVIFVDSPDPVGAATTLFTDHFYRNCELALQTGGIFICQTGVPFLQPDELKDTSEALEKIFDHVGAFRAEVPYLIGGDIVFSWASSDCCLGSIANDSWLMRANRIASETRQYTPAIHQAAFHLPKTTLKLLTPGRQTDRVSYAYRNDMPSA